MSVYSYNGQPQGGQIRAPSGNEFHAMENHQPRPFSEPMTGTTPLPPGQYGYQNDSRLNSPYGDPRMQQNNQMDPYMQQNHQNDPRQPQQHRSDPRLGGDQNQGNSLQSPYGLKGQSSSMSIHTGQSTTTIAGGQIPGQMPPGSMGGQMHLPAINHTPPSPAASQINIHGYGQNQGNPASYVQNQANNGMTQQGINQNPANSNGYGQNQANHGMAPNEMNQTGINQNGMNANGMNPNGMNQNQNQNGMNPNGMNQNQNQNGMNPNGMNQNQNQNGMNGTNQMQNGMNQSGMNQVQNGMNQSGMNQMQNGMEQNGINMNQANINGRGQADRRSIDSQMTTSALNRLSQGTIRRLSIDRNLELNATDANIQNQIDQIIRSRANSLDNNQLNPVIDPNLNPNPNVQMMEQFNGQPSLVDGAVQGICRMDMNGVSSNNAQLEKMLNSAIASAFQKGYQCKKKELRCCKIKKRRCPPPQQPCCYAPIPMCALPRQNPCPPGGSPGNCCDCQGMVMCGKAVQYPPSVTNFERIRPLKIPGFDIFSQAPKCGTQAPEVRSASCINPCCKPRPVCKPACPPLLLPQQPQQCAPMPCRKPVDSSNVPTCVMVPFRVPAQTKLPACPRRSRKQCGCRPSEYVQSLLEISAALCDQQCALVKLMSDFRV